MRSFNPKESTENTLKVEKFEPREISKVSSHLPKPKTLNSQFEGQKHPSINKSSSFVVSSLAKSAKDQEEERKRNLELLIHERVEALKYEAQELAQKKGFQEGFDLGFQEGQQSAQQSIQKILDRLSNFLLELDKAKILIFEQNEKFLIDMIYRISRMILLKELSTDREYLVRLARTLIERTGVRENITLQISSEDASLIEVLKGGLIQQFGTLKNLSVEVSSQVKPGGASIETECSTIETHIDEQLENIRKALLPEISAAVEQIKGSS